MKYTLVAINLTNVTEGLQSQHADYMTFLTALLQWGGWMIPITNVYSNLNPTTTRKFIILIMFV